MENHTEKSSKKALKAWVLFVVAVVAYGLSWVLGSESIIGSGVRLIGFLTLIFAIVAFVRERRAKKKAPVS